MKKLIYIVSVLTLFLLKCNNNDTQKTSIEQINIDKSNNYKYIFKDIIDKENEEKKKKIDPFKN